MESEFFGYRKGAFTGAEADRNGFFQAADGGTLFLDESGDLPLSMQVKLLRVLQEKKVRKVGATAEESHRRAHCQRHPPEPGCAGRGGRFRQDLYYRLNVIDLLMPVCVNGSKTSRDGAFSAQQTGRRRRQTRSRRRKSTLRLRLPGNVRELENTLERALALCDNQHIRAADLNLGPRLPASQAAPGSKYPLQDYLDQMERAAILEALEQTRFNKTAAARVLGVHLPKPALPAGTVGDRIG